MNRERTRAMTVQRSITETSLISPSDSSQMIRTKTVGGQKIRFSCPGNGGQIPRPLRAGWSYEIRHVTGIGGKLIVVARISIPSRRIVTERRRVRRRGCFKIWRLVEQRRRAALNAPRPSSLGALSSMIRSREMIAKLTRSLKATRKQHESRAIFQTQASSKGDKLKL